MKSVEIRPALIEDIPAIGDLSRRAYEKWATVLGRKPLPMTADYDAAFRRHRFDLAYIEGCLAGLVETVTDGDALLVENLAISPDYQRQGLGTRLMAHAESLARAQGLRALTLYTNRRFIGNVELYQRLGFVVTGEEALADGSARVDMRLSL